MEQLLEVARHKRTAIMCAERLPWQCYRLLVSDFLAANGDAPRSIMSRMGKVKSLFIPDPNLDAVRSDGRRGSRRPRPEQLRQ